MPSRRLQPARTAIFLLAWLGFAGRILVPAGLMPAPLAEGWPLRVCPSSSELASLLEPAPKPQGEHAVHCPMHGEPEKKTPARHVPCPLGAGFASCFLTAELGFAVWMIESAPPAPLSVAPVTADLATPAQPRGPPPSLRLEPPFRDRLAADPRALLLS